MGLKRFNEYLQEGVYDPSIFKVFFLAGGPGSGKSYVQKRVTSGLGLKLVNSDTAFEHLLKAAGLSLDLTKIDPEKRDAVRDRAKEITSTKMGLYVHGRLGLIIDGTARDYAKTKKQKEGLQRLGYESYMIFVNTSLETALERNKKRDRVVPEDIVTKSHKDVQSNIGRFQGLFKDKFIIIDNNDAKDDILNMAYKQVKKFAAKPPKNKLAKKWIANELEKKKRK
tara:strand:- start:5042 stop:5716 length:675 start_codon:yes stop_codon:yes gene_type:complete